MLWEKRSRLTTIHARCDVELFGVWLSVLHERVTFDGMKGALYPILLSGTVVFHYTIDP